MNKLFDLADLIIRGCFIRLRVLYYRLRLGWGVIVAGQVKIFGNRSNLIFKGHTSINAFCVIGARDDAKIIVEDFVSISPGVTIISYGLDYKITEGYRPHISYGDIHIKSRVWICANATILGGVTIGEWSVVGAGAVVKDDVPPYCVVAGNPAVVIKRLK